MRDAFSAFIYCDLYILGALNSMSLEFKGPYSGLLWTRRDGDDQRIAF